MRDSRFHLAVERQGSSHCIRERLQQSPFKSERMGGGSLPVPPQDKGRCPWAQAGSPWAQAGPLSCSTLTHLPPKFNLLPRHWSPHHVQGGCTAASHQVRTWLLTISQMTELHRWSLSSNSLFPTFAGKERNQKLPFWLPPWESVDRDAKPDYEHYEFIYRQMCNCTH